MNAFPVCCGLVIAGAIGFLAGGNTVTHNAFDYESCKAIVAKGSLDTNPGVPEDWKAMVTTPGGNWCIR